MPFPSDTGSSSTQKAMRAMGAAAAPGFLATQCRKLFSLKSFQNPSPAGMHELQNYRMLCQEAFYAPFGSGHRVRADQYLLCRKVSSKEEYNSKLPYPRLWFQLLIQGVLHSFKCH